MRYYDDFFSTLGKRCAQERARARLCVRPVCHMC